MSVAQPRPEVSLNKTGFWMDGWMDGWKGVKTLLRIAYNNQTYKMSRKKNTKLPDLRPKS